MIAFLEASLMRPLVLVLAAWLMLRLLRVRHPASRHAVWTAVLVGMLALPILSVVAPHWTLSVLPWRQDVPVEAPAPIPAAVPQPDADVDASSPIPTPLNAQDGPTSFAWPSAVTLIVWCYLAGLFVMGMYHFTGWMLLRRVVARSRALRAGRLLESSDVFTPVAVGVLRPSVILPIGWRDWNGSTRRAVLAHEFAHLRRRDTLVAALARLVKCVFWFHPIAWWVSRHTNDLAELACDAAALERVGDPAGYSRVLIAFAQTVKTAGRRVALPGLAMASASHVGDRVDQVFELSSGTMKRLARPRAWLLAIGLPALCLAATVGLGASASAQATADKSPHFDVVSVKPCDPNAPGAGRGGWAGTASPGGLRVDCQPLYQLISMAYESFANGRVNASAAQETIEPAIGSPKTPDWIRSERFTIEAKTDGATRSPEVMRGPMLQAVLEDRFTLKIHHQTRVVPVYELVAAKGGSKLMPFKPGSCVPYDASVSPQPPLEQGQRRCSNSTERNTARDGYVDMAEATTLDGLAASLNGEGRPVVNKTGISGLITFRLEYTDHESFVAGLRDQLGLELRQATGPRDFLVIDHVERPMPNVPVLVPGSR